MRDDALDLSAIVRRVRLRVSIAEDLNATRYCNRWSIARFPHTRQPTIMNCPQHQVCIAHPATIDMTRVANALAMVMHTTGPALLPALGDKPVPGNNHYLTTVYGEKPEWWNVVIIGCTSPATYNSILTHKSFAYIAKLMAQADPSLLKPTPTNLFLYFAVKQTPMKSSM